MKSMIEKEEDKSPEAKERAIPVARRHRTVLQQQDRVSSRPGLALLRRDLLCGHVSQYMRQLLPQGRHDPDGGRHRDGEEGGAARAEAHRQSIATHTVVLRRRLPRQSQKGDHPGRSSPDRDARSRLAAQGGRSQATVRVLCAEKVFRQRMLKNKMGFNNAYLHVGRRPRRFSRVARRSPCSSSRTGRPHQRRRARAAQTRSSNSAGYATPTLPNSTTTLTTFRTSASARAGHRATVARMRALLPATKTLRSPRRCCTKTLTRTEIRTTTNR